MPDIITTQTPAKLNLALRITGRRAVDGYHLLRMLNVSIDLLDTLKVHFKESGQDQLTVLMSDLVRSRLSEAEYQALSNGENNSCTKAILKFRSAFGFSSAVAVTINKEIPSAAGLGGGSSDAAAMLLALAARLFPAETVATRITRLLPLAAQVGADVPYFLLAGCALVTGVGEEVAPIAPNPLCGREVILIVPPFGCSTPKVYETFRELHSVLGTNRVTPSLDPSSTWVHSDSLSPTFVSSLTNDLEAAACVVVPQLGEMLRSLRGIKGIFVGMTGSGSVLFSLPVDSSIFGQEHYHAIEVRARQWGCTLMRHKIA